MEYCHHHPVCLGWHWQQACDLLFKEGKILGSSQNDPEHLYEALDFVAKGKVKVITETFPLADIAKANRLEPGARLTIGDRLVIPGVRTSQAAPTAGPAARAAATWGHCAGGPRGWTARGRADTTSRGGRRGRGAGARRPAARGSVWAGRTRSATATRSRCCTVDECLGLDAGNHAGLR